MSRLHCYLPQSSSICILVFAGIYTVISYSTLNAAQFGIYEESSAAYITYKYSIVSTYYTDSTTVVASGGYNIYSGWRGLTNSSMFSF